MNKITILNFDQTYRQQSFYHNEEFDWIDLDFIPNTNLYCERTSLMEIDSILKRPSFLTYIGSGNYHYMTYLLMSKITKPFSLILFDHHTDTLANPSESIISCGSWVLNSLQSLPHLKKAILIGARNDGKIPFPSSLANKIHIFTEEIPQVNTVLNKIPTESVYISIDKDVLSQKEAVTGWDQGKMTLKQVGIIMKRLFQLKDIIGIDVCGEYPMNPTNVYTRQTKEAQRKNNDANDYILQKVKEFLQINPRKLIPKTFYQHAERLSHQV